MIVANTPSTDIDYPYLSKAFKDLVNLNSEIEKNSAKAKDYADLYNVKRRIDITDQSVRFPAKILLKNQLIYK